MENEGSKRQQNAKWNIAISSLIFLLGTSSLFISVFFKEKENYLFAFRYMTVNGTLFSTLVALIVIILNIAEIKTGRDHGQQRLYFLRLSSAVTEGIIAVVIAMSFFPTVPDNPNILSYDSFSMHVIIPVLSIISFLLNPFPAEHMRPLAHLNCAWLITLYAAVVITLIFIGLIPPNKIPYSFMDFTKSPVWYIVYFGCFIYSFTYVLSFLLSGWNRRVSSKWHPTKRKPISPEKS